MRFKPIYGWGWKDQSGTTIDVPEPFDTAPLRSIGEDGVVYGLSIVSSGPLTGKVVKHSPRHVPFDGDVDLSIHMRSAVMKDLGFDPEPEITGYAQIPTGVNT